jgi:hypothetical protein
MLRATHRKSNDDGVGRVTGDIERIRARVRSKEFAADAQVLLTVLARLVHHVVCKVHLWRWQAAGRLNAAAAETGGADGVVGALSEPPPLALWAANSRGKDTRLQDCMRLYLQMCGAKRARGGCATTPCTPLPLSAPRSQFDAATDSAHSGHQVPSASLGRHVCIRVGCLYLEGHNKPAYGARAGRASAVAGERFLVKYPLGLSLARGAWGRGAPANRTGVQARLLNGAPD